MDRQKNEEMRAQEIEAACRAVDALNNSKDKYVVYRTSRPIINLKQMLESSVQLYGDNVAFHQRFVKGEPFRKITYQETLADVNGLGTALLARGLGGKRIAIIGENGYQWATAYLATVCGVGVAVPLDKELSAEELKQLIIEAEASCVCFTKKYEAMFREMQASGDTQLSILVNLNKETRKNGETDDAAQANDGVQANDASPVVYAWADLKEEGKQRIAAGDRAFLDAQIDANAMGVLLFTSGTTGIAKGVMLSHRNICEDLMSAPTILNVNSWDIFFSVLPIHHTYECTCGFLMPLYKGASIAYCEGLKYIVKNLQEVRPTMFLAVPLIFENLYKNIMKNIRKSGKEALVRKVMAVNKVTKKIGLDLNRKFLKDIYALFGGRMRCVISGGAAIDPAILQFFNDLGMIAVQGYGLTECAPMAALNPDSHKWMRNRAVGHLLPGMEVKIEDADEEGIGEICLRGPNVMLGYYHMPEATAAAIVDGWFHTGDQGYVDDEDFIYITGRKKNVIIAANGKNVFPEELEYYLSGIPYVEESMVWSREGKGVNDTTIVATIKPDREEVEAAIGKEAADDGEAVKRLLWSAVDEVNLSLPFFKKIREIVVRSDEFEKTTGKKIKRFVEENKQVSAE